MIIALKYCVDFCHTSAWLSHWYTNTASYLNPVPISHLIQMECCHCFPVTESCPTLCHPWTAACQASLSFTVSKNLLKLMSIELVRPSNHLTFCHVLLLPSIFPSIMVFSNELVRHIRLPKYWSFSFSINPCNVYTRLISFRIDLFDLIAV